MDVVPLISSTSVGPLGIAHLPRLWLKILLHAAGRLPPGYRHGNGGFDERLCQWLGIERDAFVAYIERERPDYLALERWVCEHAANLTPHAIADWNRRVAAASLPEEMAVERRARFGLADQATAGAVALNDLDDWGAVHATLVHEAPERVRAESG